MRKPQDLKIGDHIVTEMFLLLLSLRKFQDFGGSRTRNHGEDQIDIRNVHFSHLNEQTYIFTRHISHIQICTSGSAFGQVQSRIAAF